MGKAEFRDAQRDQSSVLAPLEKRALVWFAQHMPRWVNSDHLTILGFLGMSLAGVCYWAVSWDRRALLWTIGCLFVNWFGDSLDGTVARVRNRQRPRYGFYVDHITDTFGSLFLIGGLGLSGLMSEWIAIALLLAFFMMSIQSYLAAYALGTFQLSFWKFSPTELRALLIAGNIAVYVRGPMAHVFGREFRLFDVGGAIGAAVMAAMLVFFSIRNTVLLYKAERLP
jgi:archaetidylinositol phosphate synthase